MDIYTKGCKTDVRQKQCEKIEERYSHCLPNEVSYSPSSSIRDNSAPSSSAPLGDASDHTPMMMMMMVMVMIVTYASTYERTCALFVRCNGNSFIGKAVGRLIIMASLDHMQHTFIGATGAATCPSKHHNIMTCHHQWMAWDATAHRSATHSRHVT
eukprot:GHVU01072324.1.p1 GENE.GHVU01072324.1~~GHVU01072324.1.p1  ORF type:complete len:156 (+),score=12.12 GHVU01072324.1:683-1150(+)